MTTSAAPQIDLDEIARLSTTRPVRVRIGRLIDGVSDHPQRNIDVVFNAASIHSVEPASADVDADATLPDHTLLPCLIEAHAHLFLDGAPVNFQQRSQFLLWQRVLSLLLASSFCPGPARRWRPAKWLV